MVKKRNSALAMVVIIQSLLMSVCATAPPTESDQRLQKVYNDLQDATAESEGPEATVDAPTTMGETSKATANAPPTGQSNTLRMPYGRQHYGMLIPPPERVNPPGTIPCYLHRSPLGNHPDVVKVRNDTSYPLELRDNANGVAVAGAPHGWLPPAEACYYILPQHGKHNLRAVMWRLDLYKGRPTAIAILQDEEYFSPTSSRLHFVVWTGTEERVR